MCCPKPTASAIKINWLAFGKLKQFAIRQ